MPFLCFARRWRPIREEPFDSCCIMNFPLFIARRIYRGEGMDGVRVSRPAVTIAICGIAVGLAVMIVSIAVAWGFKQEIRDKVTGFGAHIQIANYNRTESYDSYPIVGDEDVMTDIRTASSGVGHVQRFVNTPGMLKTDKAFQGIFLKGIAQEYDTTFIAQHLVEGRIPHFTDSVASGEVLVSRRMADKMGLRLGDKIYTYYMQENVRARRFVIKGIYRTDFAEYDDRFLITDLYTARRLSGWHPDQVSGLEVLLADGASMDDTADEVAAVFNRRLDLYGNAYLTQSIAQLYPSIFAWLDVLDTNVWVILILMIGVAGFTMISGLLILILERTNMIGLLKALGATDFTIRRVFLWFAVFLIGKGLFWGNLTGGALCLLQHFFGIIKLDPATYYVETVPLRLDFLSMLLLNVCTLFVSVLMLVGPSLLISRIKPATSLRFE